jgi:DNA-binding beta-propeller fold protein YncE
VELTRAPLAGAPDVVFFNPEHRRLYVATGEPGLIEVFETDRMRLIQTVRTGSGAHTLGFDQLRNTVYAFLPDTHRALVFRDNS